LALVLALSAAAPAADWPVARGPSHEPQPYRYDPGRWKQLPRAFLEDAPACTLYAGTTYLVEADGTVENVTHEIVRFNSRKAVEKLGEYRSISYDPAYQKLTLNVARVHKADGHSVPIEPKHLQLRDLGTDYLVYDHDKQLIISFPNLEVGDVIEVKWTTRGKNPEYQGHFFTRYTFGDDRYPVALDELRVRLPKSRTLKYATVNGKVEPIVRDEGDDRLYLWRVTDRRELPQDESLPPREEMRLQVACSTFADWDEVGRWRRQLVADCWKCTEEVEKVVQEVTRGLDSAEAKARALTYWVRRHIRYVSLGPVTHDYSPHPPAVVFANRFGDCKDQSQLLAVMLRKAGLPVALVTLGTLDDGQVLPEVPSPWGTHAILLVTLDGRDHWIDTTLSLARWDELPREDRDRLTYVLDDGLRLARTPALNAAGNRVEQSTQVRVAADGTAHCRRAVTYHGAAALAQREAWTDVPPGERRRLAAADLQDAHSKSRLRRLAVDEARLRDLDKPVQARLEFDIPGHFAGEADREGHVSDSKVWNRLLSYNLDYDRRAALDLGTPFESVHRYSVKLPPAYRFDGLPRDQQVRSAWGSFRLSVRADPEQPRQIDLEFHTRLDKTRVEPADFAAFRKFQEEVGKHWRVYLTLKPTQELDDALALEARLVLAPGDSANAAVLARLYYQNGKADQARRVLRQARLFRPDDAALWELTVKTAASAEEEEAAYQELVHRFPEEAKYVVSLGATRVKRGDYAGARAVLEPLAVKGTASARGQAHFQLARSCLVQQKPKDALKHLEEAGKADPDAVASATALHLRGQVQEQLGKADEAAESYRQALKVDTDAEEPLAALVRLELAADRQAEALDYLRRYTVAVADNPAGMVKAAEFHLRLGRLDDALDLAGRARGQGQTGPADKVLGLVYLNRGEVERAVSHLDGAEPDDAVREGLVRCNLLLGRLTAAEQAAAAEASDGPSPDLRRARALVTTLKKRRAAVLKKVRVPAGKAGAAGRAVDAFVCAEWALAEEQKAGRVAGLLASAVDGGVEVGPAFALRGRLALEKGRLTKALADAERAVALSPGEAAGYYVRGRVRLERGGDGALDDLTRAARLSRRKDGLILHWLAAALQRAGRHAEALTAQREAVKLRPHDAEILEQLKELERAE
jgi:tetratricopeptide (TPR) repeat protein